MSNKLRIIEIKDDQPSSTLKFRVQRINKGQPWIDVKDFTGDDKVTILHQIVAEFPKAKFR